MQKKDLSKIKWGEIYTCDLGSMKGSVQCGVRDALEKLNEKAERQDHKMVLPFSFRFNV